MNIFDLASFSALLPVIPAVWWLGRIKSPLHYLALWAIVAACFEAVTFYLASQKTNNLWVVHVYTPVEFVFLSLVYYHTFSRRRIRFAMVGMVVVVAVVSALNAFVIGDLQRLNTYARALSLLLLMCYAILYFDKVFRELRVKHLEKDPLFLLSAGGLLFFSGTILIYVFFNRLLAHSAQVTLTILNVHSILVILFQATMAMALWQAPKS